MYPILTVDTVTEFLKRCSLLKKKQELRFDSVIELDCINNRIGVIKFL